MFAQRKKKIIFSNDRHLNSYRNVESHIILNNILNNNNNPESVYFMKDMSINNKTVS